jgi:hypothetical protein
MQQSLRLGVQQQRGNLYGTSPKAITRFLGPRTGETPRLRRADIDRASWLLRLHMRLELSVYAYVLPPQLSSSLSVCHRSFRFLPGTCKSLAYYTFDHLLFEPSKEDYIVRCNITNLNHYDHQETTTMASHKFSHLPRATSGPRECSLTVSQKPSPQTLPQPLN